MARYRCTNCDTTFEADTDAPRCPECLRQHGLEEVGKPAPARPPTRRRGLLVAVVALVVALGGGAALWLLRGRVEPRPGLGPIAPAALEEFLASRGVSRADRVDPFATSPAIKKLADGVSGSGAVERARAVARRVAGALRPARLEIDLLGASDAPVRTAAELQRLIDDPKATPRAVLSFELATHTVAALRAAGIRAVLGRARRLDAPVATADVAGGVGRYVALVYSESKAAVGPPALVLDPARALPLPAWAGGGDDPDLKPRLSLERKTPPVTPLDDASAAGHLLALRAHRLRAAEPDRAYQLSQEALAVAAPSPMLLLLRSKVLAAAGGTADAEAAAQKALTLAQAGDGPATRTLLALALASKGSSGPAISHLEQAVQADPGYWPAYRALASILLPADRKRGLEYLNAGLKIAPDEPGLLLLQATRLLAEDQAGEAVKVLERALARQPSELLRLMLYRALRQSSDPRAAQVREELLGQSKDRAKLEKLLEALDQSLGAPASAPASPPPPPPRLKLPDVRLGQ